MPSSRPNRPKVSRHASAVVPPPREVDPYTVDLPLQLPLATSAPQLRRPGGIARAPTRASPFLQLGGGAALDHAALQQRLPRLDAEVVDGLAQQLVALGCVSGGLPDEAAVALALGLVVGLQPRDAGEAMLATHMALVNKAVTTALRRFEQAHSAQEAEAAERSLNRLLRMSNEQLLTLQRMRNGGQQKMTVEHLTIQHGGQAIVGHVNTGAGDAPIEGDASNVGGGPSKPGGSRGSQR
jgi:hypothetical protein